MPKLELHPWEQDDPKKAGTPYKSEAEVKDSGQTSRGSGSHQGSSGPSKPSTKIGAPGWDLREVVEAIDPELAQYVIPEGSGNAGSTQESASDKTWHAVMLAKWTFRLLRAEVDPEALAAEVNAIKAEFKASGWHGQVDLLDFLGWDVPEVVLEAEVVAFMDAAAARLGDPTAHGSPLGPGVGSPDVFIGGIPAWRTAIDFHACPLSTPLPHGGGVIAKGEATVLINGTPAVRRGDFVIEPVGGPNPVMGGFALVQIGKPPPPVTTTIPRPEPPMIPWLSWGLDGAGDLAYGKAEAGLGASVDAKAIKGDVYAKAGAMVAAARGEIAGSTKIDIPWTSYKLTLGVTLEGSGLSAGAEAGVRGVINGEGADGKRKLLDFEAGAKAGAGLFGGGAKFAVGVE